jgi:hypothetical protein
MSSDFLSCIGNVYFLSGLTRHYPLGNGSIRTLKFKGCLRVIFLASAPLMTFPFLSNQTMAPVGHRSMATVEAKPFLA